MSAPNSGKLTKASKDHTIGSSSDDSIILAALKTPFEDRAAPLWRVWNCIDDLLDESSPDNRMMAEPYRPTTIQVASILQTWAKRWAGEPLWKSVLNKCKLRNEAEESIVALHHLRQWMTAAASSPPLIATTSTSACKDSDEKQQQQPKKFIAVDVCGGKGFFSMLLSYIASDFWNPALETNCSQQLKSIEMPWRLDKIVLLEKATASDIDWGYIHEANGRSDSSTPSNNIIVPKIEIWSDTNLHKYDDLLPKLQDLCSAGTSNSIPLALTGIHLCKMLSPSLVSIANGLGPTLSPYLCLAPCCMPRMVTSTSKGSCRAIPIQLFETSQERESRMDHNRRKMSSRKGRTCFLCHSKGHWVRKCPQMEAYSEAERDRIVEQAAAATPCWTCGVDGHLRPDCPTPDVRIARRCPPTVEMDVSDIRTSSNPYERYCELLAKNVGISSDQASNCGGDGDDRDGGQEPKSKKLKLGSFNVQVFETGLTASGSHQEGNWNSRRKSIFIVAAR